jgi:hypothetical protein
VDDLDGDCATFLVGVSPLVALAQPGDEARAGKWPQILATHATLTAHKSDNGSYARARVEAIVGKVCRKCRMCRNSGLLRRWCEVYAHLDAPEAAPPHTGFVLDPREPPRPQGH